MRVGLHVLVPGLAMQQGLVAFLQTDFPCVQSAPVSLRVELLQVLSADPAHISQNMTESFAIGIVTGKLCVHHHPR